MHLVKIITCLVLITVICCGSAVSAGEISFRSFEARLGFISIGESGAGSTFGISGTADLGSLTETIGLEVGFDFWKKSYDVGFLDWSWTNTSLNCNGRYEFSFNSDAAVYPYVFAGIVLSNQKVSWDNNDTFCTHGCDLNKSNLEFGINFGAAAEFGSGEGMIPVARVGYSTSGGVDYFFLSGGIKF